MRRGSSVSSIVCYLTGLSHVDPVRAGLFPGRFLNDEVIRALKTHVDVVSFQTFRGPPKEA